MRLIYTAINFTDEFRNVSVTLRVGSGLAGWAWRAWSTHAEYRKADLNLKP